MIRETVKDARALVHESYKGLKELLRPESRYHTIEDAKRRQKAREALVKDLLSPFIACISEVIKIVQDWGDIEEMMNGCAATEEFRRLKGKIFQFTESDSESDSETVLSIDSKEEEAMQLQRLTSWDTNEMSSSMSLSISTIDGDGPMKITDDDGNIIPPELVEKIQKQREKRRRRRKRVVRFDYPPIKSLRECPRHNPEDLQNLFFTEEELDEIEADRLSTIAADDIEIVAVGPTKSSSFDKPERNSSQLGSSSSLNSPRQGNATFDQNESDSSDLRLIKRVQIYLRERSAGKRS